MKSQNKSRKAYDAKTKLEICNFAEGHTNREASRRFGVDEANVRRWRKNKSSFGQQSSRHKSLRYKTPQWPELERELRQWILDRRTAKLRVTTTAAKLQSKIVANRMSIQSFKACDVWFSRFKNRANLAVRFRTSVGQALPPDLLEKTELFRACVAEKKGQNNISLHNFINMDEVPCAFDLPGSRTLDERGAQDITMVTTGKEKSNFTIVLAVTASGEKLTPLAIFKRKTMPKERFPNGILVRVNPKGWINSALMEEWLEVVWKRRPSAFFNKPKPTDCLLIYDACRAHLTEDVKSAVRRCTQLAVIPGGLTKVLQPLDISVNKSFKQKLRESWDEWIMDETLAEYTKSGNRKRASLTTVCEWIKSAWQQITPGVIKNGFEKGGLHSYPQDTQLEPEAESVEVDVPDNDSEADMEVDHEDMPEVDPLEIEDDENDLVGDEFDGWEENENME